MKKNRCKDLYSIFIFYRIKGNKHCIKTTKRSSSRVKFRENKFIEFFLVQFVIQITLKFEAKKNDTKKKKN